MYETTSTLFRQLKQEQTDLQKEFTNHLPLTFLHPYNENNLADQANKIKVIMHNEKNNIIRRLTPIECERLQGFPDNYTQIPYRGKPKEECPVSHRYEACGRAMSINVMEYMGDRLKKVHNGEI